MASSRLHGKALLDLAGKPTLTHVLDRARHIQGIDHLVLATTTNTEDDVIADWGATEAVDVFRGSEDNVAERLLLATDLFAGTHLARITADCPLIDPAVCSRVIETCLNEDADFGSNYCPPTFPDGLDFSLSRVSVLKRAIERNPSEYDLEHVTTVFERDLDSYKTINVSSDVDLSEQRWTMDNIDDLHFLRALFNKLLEENSGSDHRVALRILGENPEIARLQSRAQRNYGHDRNATAQT